MLFFLTGPSLPPDKIAYTYMIALGTLFFTDIFVCLLQCTVSTIYTDFLYYFVLVTYEALNILQMDACGGTWMDE